MEGVQTELGARLREARMAKNLALRELSRRIGVSASMISQLERGAVMPSVATLYRLVSELGISMDELFNGEEPGTALAPAIGDDELDRERKSEPTVQIHEPANSPVQRKGSRPTVTLDTGVIWQRLTHSPDAEVEFLWSRYPVGAESCPPNALMRHSGREFGYIERGRLGVTVGFETYELGPGDSVSFESTRPHRLFTIGDEPADVIWFVLDRGRDAGA